MSYGNWDFAYGTKAATYTSMRDKPAELFMDGVFNADKDLVNREDVKNAALAVKSLEGRKSCSGRCFRWSPSRC